MSELKTKWNQRYQNATVPSEPVRVLLENVHLLPTQGTALDLASGLGVNAIYLAKLGLQTSAWDIAEVAIAKLQQAALENSLCIDAHTRDVIENPPKPHSFDVILVSRFLHRELCSALIEALKPGGILFYQTFTRHSGLVAGPSNPKYLLETNELLSLFSPLQVLAYRDESDIGDTQVGLRGEAYLVARKFAAQ